MPYTFVAIGGIFGNTQAPLARASAFNSNRDSAPGSRDQRGFFVPELTAEQVRAAFRYEADTGILFWNSRRPGVRLGTPAGCRNNHGHLIVRLDYKIHYVHRLVWLYVYGVMPQNCIDHINCIRHDNRLSNLRDVSVAENSQNRQKAQSNNSCGFLGVTKRRNKWEFCCKAFGKAITKGGFATPELAYAAYIETRRTMQPGNML